MGIIQRQSLQNTIVTYLGIVVGFISLLYIQPKFLTKDEIGLVRILLSFSALAGAFFPLGIGSITLRFFPFFKNKEKNHNGYFGFMMLLPLAGYIVVALVLFFLRTFIEDQYRRESPLFTEYFNYVFVFIFMVGFNGVFTVYSYALSRTIFPSIVNEVYIKIAYVVVILFYYFCDLSLNTFISFLIGTYVLQFLLILFFIYKIDNPGFKIDWEFLRTQNPKKMISYGMIISLSAMASMGLKYIDVIILAKYVSLSKVAVYALAAFVPTIIEAPLNALDKTTGSQIGDAWAKNRIDLIEVIYFKSTKYLMLLGGLLFLGINCNLESLFRIIPNNFEEGIPVAMIISIGTFFNLCTGINGGIVYYSSKFIYGTYFVFILIVLAVVNNFLFIPRYGIVGAAMATMLSAFIYNALLFVFIWKKFRLQPFDMNSLKTIIIIAFIFVLNYFFPSIENAFLDIAVKSTLISVVYLAAVYFLNIVPEFHKYVPFLKGKS